MARLEEIVAALETGTLDLGQTLALFEEGVNCLREAGGALSAAESRVKRLTEAADGAFEVVDLDDE